MSREAPITINPNTNEVEDPFRERVRDILNLDWSSRNENIFAELRRLKKLEERVQELEESLAGADT